MAERESLPRQEGTPLDVDAVARGLAELEQAMVDRTRIREAVALHARTLDDMALGHHAGRDRDAIDNDLYNAVRALDPEWWDARVPGLARTSP